LHREALALMDEPE